MTTSTEERALELLGAGIEQVNVANALGVTESRISQILSNPIFAERLVELKFHQLKKHNETDNRYDKLENKVLDALERTLAMVMDPMKLANILTRLNQAKRRGSSAPDSLVRQRATIRLNISQQVVGRFAVNGANQVVQASIGEESQDLVTIQSGGVQRLLNEHIKNANQLALEPPPDGTKQNTQTWREYRKEVRAAEPGESDGRIWRKPQGREKHDLLTECGFAHEINVSVEQPASSGKE